MGIRIGKDSSSFGPEITEEKVSRKESEEAIAEAEKEGRAFKKEKDQ